MAGTGGTIFQRADGKWVAMTEAGWTRQGTRRRKKFVAATKAAARNRLRDYLATASATDTSINQRLTIKRYATNWITDQATRLRPGTFITTRGAITKWIIPAFGHKMLTEVTAADLRRMSEQMRAAGLSTTTIGRVIGTTKKMLTDARREGYTVPDSIFAAQRPAKAISTRESLPPADALTLLISAAHKETWPPLPPDPTPRHPDGRMIASRHWTPAQHREVKAWTALTRERAWASSIDATRWLAALLQGLRQGEALGLTWDHVDFDAGQIIIEQELQRIPSTGVIPDGLAATQLDKSMWLLPPKTRAGMRVIPMVPLMADALKAWKEAAPASPHRLVWPRPDGTPMSAALDRLAWRGLQAATGIRHPDGRPYLVHEARHTTVTLLHAVGAPPEVIIAIVGHSTYASTRPYLHPDLSVKARAALESVAELLSR